MTLDELVARIASIASTQHGLVRTAQLAQGERVGVRHLARRGHLARVAKGVYRIAGAPVTWEQRLTAAAWALGEDAVVSHSAAARIWGFEHFIDDALEVTVPRRQRGRAVDQLGVTVHSTLWMPRGDVRSRSGLRVTSPERTIVDLARARTAQRRLEAAVDSALRLRLTTLERVIDRASAERGPARWGVGRLDLVLLDAGGHTTLERLFLRLVRESGLPIPVPQVVHRHEGRHVARVDFLFADHDLVVEVSGGRGHSSPSERAKDARRRNELQRLGRTVLEFTYEQVTRRPDQVIATLTEFLGRVTVLRAPATKS